MVTFDDLVSRSPCIIEPDKKTILVIEDFDLREDILITDNRTNEERRVMGLVMRIRSEDGVPCDKPWNLIARKAIADVRPHIEDRSGLPLKISVLKHMGDGFPTYEIGILERGVKL